MFDLKRFDELQLFYGAAIKKQPIQEKQIDHIGKWLEEIANETQEMSSTITSLDADEIAEIISTESEIEVISKADALTLLSKEAENEIRNRLKVVQAKMKIEAPDMSLLFKYNDWKEFFTIYPELPSSDYYIGGESFWSVYEEYEEKYNEIMEEKERLEEQYSKQYPREGLEFVGPGIDEVTARGMYISLFDKKFAPVYSNPFDYLNPDDIIIQSLLIQRYTKKYLILDNYLRKFEEEISEKLDEKAEIDYQEYSKLQDEYAEKAEKIYEREEEDCEKTCKKGHNEDMHKKYRQEQHVLALAYYEKFKTGSENRWKDATDYAREMYKMYEETLPVIYNDIMKYIMLISDKDVQEELETEVNLAILNSISNVNYLIQSFFEIGYVQSFNDDGYAEFDCTSYILKEDQRQKIESEIKDAAIERFRTAMKGKAAFDAKILDENSQFYKETIEKYEYKVNFIFLEYKTNEYKSTTKMNFNIGVAGFNMAQTENHYNGSVKMEGNLELGAKIGTVKTVEIGAVGKFGFTATMDANKQLVPNSVDIRAGIEAGATMAKSIEAKGGIEASVMRGTKVYGNIGLTANKVLKDLKVKAVEKGIGRDLTDFEKAAGIFPLSHHYTKLPNKTLWQGEYVIIKPEDNKVKIKGGN